MKLLLMVTAVAFLLCAVQSLPLLRSSGIFGRRRATERPLLALSLESSETAPAAAPEDSSEALSAAAGELKDDGAEENSYEWDEPPTYHELWASTSQSFYDVLLNVLQLVGNQVRQEVQRARVQQAALDTVTSSDEYYDDYDDYDNDDDNGDDLMG
ncbi:uncharacterized protein LOC118458414 isoform X2 [Anopheles albimanus]|uniref:uncharacterized protein LOC118458414 isoform X2 n=1 Tax=Anopheles albimanus TaxID=7167 RepID=UPI00163F0215|nr:uncharacterized protein LOC118458414 isoform X2 [Anopheles albimanus]